MISSQGRNLRQGDVRDGDPGPPYSISHEEMEAKEGATDFLSLSMLLGALWREQRLGRRDHSGAPRLPPGSPPLCPPSQGLLIPPPTPPPWGYLAEPIAVAFLSSGVGAVREQGETRVQMRCSGEV